MTRAQDNAPPSAEQDSGSEDHPGRQAATGIAETVGRVLAMAAAAANPSRPGDTAEIEAITDAMIRLLVGIPLRSDGQLTVKSLAEEAGLKRNKLTHKHTGLKDLFYALVRVQDARPKIVENLKQKNDELKQKLSRLRTEHDQLRTDCQQLVRVVHVLEIENQQLREGAGGDGVVRVLPTQHRPSAC
ncbi:MULTISPECIES: hypothetical protein [unclassified Streptomyces]|uniref:hypothetical protein n=1 Tax=unclassified Streptomyces TaxID=2593676 RepID=UPI0022502A05|nr:MULTISPECIES: hypothetical protein [unclassified Streptomyces]MCX5054759.1 hypothetical protein [Streptomyces sp. NBC_00474]